jgi:hypothetical protein
VTVITWQSAEGSELAIGTGRLTLLSAEGLDAPPLRLSIAKGPGVDGAIAAHLQLEPRRIAIEALLDLEGLDEAGMAEERAAICKALYPAKESGILRITRGTRTRSIEAVPAAAPAFAKKRWNEAWQTFRLEFVCLKPSFKSTEPVISSVRYYASLTEFGEEGIEFGEEGFEFSSIEHSGERTTTIVNDGTAPAPVRIRFTGPMVNPFIRNRTTGEIIRITQMIKAGEYLEIDTEPGRRQIRLWKAGTEQNGMHYLDLASSFFQLAPGENEIELGDESAGEGSEAFFECYGHYLEA